MKRNSLGGRVPQDRRVALQARRPRRRPGPRAACRGRQPVQQRQPRQSGQRSRVAGNDRPNAGRINSTAYGNADLQRNFQFALEVLVLSRPPAGVEGGGLAGPPPLFFRLSRIDRATGRDSSGPFPASPHMPSVAKPGYDAAMAPVDLLVFGPHPDDLEIGLGGTIAKHVGARHARRPVRSDPAASWAATARPRSGSRKPRRRGPCSARPGARTSGWPDGGIGTIVTAGARDRRADSFAPGRRSVAIPYGADRHPDHVAASQLLARGVFNAGCAAIAARRRTPGGRSGSATTSSTTRARRRSSSTCSEHYAQKRAALAATSSAVRGSGRATSRGGDAPEHAALQQLIESRDAQFGASPASKFAEGVVVRDHCSTTCSPRRRSLPGRRSRPVNIGIVCYASVGGSGIVATELARALADSRSSGPPRSAPTRRSGSATRAAAAFPPRRDAELSAVPRAAVRAVARQQDRAGGARAAARHHPRALRDPARHRGATWRGRFSPTAAAAVPRIVTTLHGTDITLVGSDPVVSRDRRLLHRAVGRRDGGVREPARGHVPRARRARATST